VDAGRGKNMFFWEKGLATCDKPSWRRRPFSWIDHLIRRREAFGQGTEPLEHYSTLKVLYIPRMLCRGIPCGSSSWHRS